MSKARDHGWGGSYKSKSKDQPIPPGTRVNATCIVSGYLNGRMLIRCDRHSGRRCCPHVVTGEAFAARLRSGWRWRPK